MNTAEFIPLLLALNWIRLEILNHHTRLFLQILSLSALEALQKPLEHIKNAKNKEIVVILFELFNNQGRFKDKVDSLAKYACKNEFI